MDQLPILILLFETLTIIYRAVFQKGVRHISIEFLICIVRTQNRRSMQQETVFPFFIFVCR